MNDQRRPRLLLLITLSERGGAQNYISALLPAVADRFDVKLAAYGHGPLSEEAAAAGVEFVELLHVRRALNPWHDALGLLELMRLIRRWRPDIVHASSSKAGVLGRLAAWLGRVRVRVFTVHGWAFEAYDGLAGWIYRWSERSMLPLTTEIICVAEYERLAGLAAGVCRAASTVVIPNAVDVASHQEAAPASDGLVELISVGRFRAPKDFITLVRALARLEPGSFRASLIGDGPDRSAIEAELDELGIAPSVRLLGDRPDVRELLARAHVFVCSSRSEGMPISILEAMAAGLPVVASAVGGVPEVVVEGRTGLLVEPGAVAPLAEALSQLIDDPALRERLGRAGREMAEQRYDLPRFRRSHLELYERLLRERGAPKRTER